MAHLYRRVREEEHWRDATLMACIVNSGFSRPKDGVKPSDFMPQAPVAGSGRPLPKHKRMTAKRREEVADGIRSLMARFTRSGAQANPGASLDEK